MNYYKYLTFILALALFFLNGCNDRLQKKNTLLIAVSSNAQFVTQELIKEYRQKRSLNNNKKNIKIQKTCNIETVIASSGKLTTMIESKAPFDIFLSANMKYPNYLYNKQLTINKPKIYAQGVLVLWINKKKLKNQLNNISRSSSPFFIRNLLLNKHIHKIAIGNPQFAPYGRAAIQFLTKILHSNTFNIIKNKFIYGANISQVSSYIISNTIDIALTAKSVLISKQFQKLQKNNFYIEIPKQYYSPINQGAVIIQYKKNLMKETKSFYQFLFSKKAKKIFNKYGYK